MQMHSGQEVKINDYLENLKEKKLLLHANTNKQILGKTTDYSFLTIQFSIGKFALSQNFM